MALDNFLSNALIQLFDNIETNSNVTFANFVKNSVTTPEHNIITKKQPYLQDYEDTFDNTVYKYLYDPNLSFDFRFHQRLSGISYEEGKQPWATIVFNTHQVRPLTNIESLVFTDFATDSITNPLTPITYKYNYRKQTASVDMVLFSNDLNYLYSTTEKINMYFDRFINFHYNEVINFSSTFSKGFEEVGHAANINPVDLTKLDTEKRGSLCSVAYSFDLTYVVVEYQPRETVPLLKRIITEYATRGSVEPFAISITE